MHRTVHLSKARNAQTRSEAFLSLHSSTSFTPLRVFLVIREVTDDAIRLGDRSEREEVVKFPDLELSSWSGEVGCNRGKPESGNSQDLIQDGYQRILLSYSIGFETRGGIAKENCH